MAYETKCKKCYRKVFVIKKHREDNSIEYQVCSHLNKTGHKCEGSHLLIDIRDTI